MRIDQKTENYILEFYFNHLALKFSSFGSWRIQIEPRDSNNEEKKEGRDKRERGREREREFKILF